MPGRNAHSGLSAIRKVKRLKLALIHRTSNYGTVFFTACPAKVRGRVAIDDAPERAGVLQIREFDPILLGDHCQGLRSLVERAGRTAHCPSLDKGSIGRVE